jgi:hypothetical protein
MARTPTTTPAQVRDARLRDIRELCRALATLPAATVAGTPHLLDELTYARNFLRAAAARTGAEAPNTGDLPL